MTSNGCFYCAHIYTPWIKVGPQSKLIVEALQHIELIALNKTRLAVILLILSSLLILAHQELTTNAGWFELDQFLHHENIAAVIIAFACGILVCHETKK